MGGVFAVTCRDKESLDSQSLDQQEAPLGVGVNYHQLMAFRERERGLCRLQPSIQSVLARAPRKNGLR